MLSIIIIARMGEVVNGILLLFFYDLRTERKGRFCMLILLRFDWLTGQVLLDIRGKFSNNIKWSGLLISPLLRSVFL